MLKCHVFVFLVYGHDSGQQAANEINTWLEENRINQDRLKEIKQSELQTKLIITIWYI